MAKYSNSGNINIEAVRDSILASGGGEHTRLNYDGSVHHSIYSTTDNRHLSFDEYPDGHVENVHTDKNGRGYMDYKGGY